MLLHGAAHPSDDVIEYRTIARIACEARTASAPTPPLSPVTMSTEEENVERKLQASCAVGHANRGATPASSLLTVQEFRDAARRSLSRAVFAYYAGGCGVGVALRENIAALLRLKLRPRVLVGEDDPKLETTILGRSVSSPIAVAPTGASAHHRCFAPAHV